MVLIEVDSQDADRAESILADIVKASEIESIYRNKMIAVAFEAGSRDEYGDVEKAEKLRFTFKTARPVEADDFVVDEEIFATIQRNIIDLHQRRDVLKAQGVPSRRGVLL